MHKDIVKISFHPGGQNIEVSVGTTILEAARLAGVNMAAPCGGTGRCGRCLVKIFSTQREGWLLACKTVVTDDLSVELATQPPVILETGETTAVTLDPAIQRGDKGELYHQKGFPLLPSANQGEEVLGLAIDIGTTTLVAYLYNLLDGSLLAVNSVVNGQQIFGADVISRLGYALQGQENYQKLRQRLLDSLNGLIERCCQSVGITTEWVRELVVVGNTPIMHFFLNLPVQGLAVAPFEPYQKGPFYRTAAELEVTTVPQAICYVPPFIGGFVGSDALAAALAQKFGREVTERMLVDIGTNGEILLQVGDYLLAASVPAGPALEGAGIECGMVASVGAISRVTLDYDVQVEVIGGGRATGICGSGLIDAIAEMLRLGLIDSSGKLLPPSQVPPIVSFKIKQRLKQVGENLRFVLAEQVYLSQKDIRAVQLAKAAVAGGIQLVIAETSLSNKPLSVLLAGGFGSYLNPSNALRIGLLGTQPNMNPQQVGNAAGAGAVLLLLSYPSRQRAERLCQQFIHRELAAEANFQTFFLEQMAFPTEEW